MSDTDMAACTQERLEDYLTQSGRELQRIAMQDYLDAADAVLALPARLHSARLQRAVVHEVADGPLRSAREALARTTGQRLVTRQQKRTLVVGSGRERSERSPLRQWIPQ
ncbi:hypothetical protein K4749_23980 [Streptomyces sp. TRM72054]|uniref:hypothetical protein n=1 Tax=Streptomyces sp. TRM72054 TaxID=2870562 RepID=UPI001C8BD626|nr:hypothetical protein [Streptomyces sp. TRM72054]MBX9396562.1 hypothetical protein [Streptomyces sp. TRM72054]